MTLASNPVELREFGEDEGLAMDTVDLFRLYRMVGMGEVTKAAARARLMEATDRFTLGS